MPAITKTQGGFKNPQSCSRRRQSAHFSSITEICADSRRRLRFLESALTKTEVFLIAVDTRKPAR